MDQVRAEPSGLGELHRAATSVSGAPPPCDRATVHSHPPALSLQVGTNQYPALAGNRMYSTKNERKQAECDVQLLANRLNHLQVSLPLRCLPPAAFDRRENYHAIGTSC